MSIRVLRMLSFLLCLCPEVELRLYGNLMFGFTWSCQKVLHTGRTVRTLAVCESPNFPRPCQHCHCLSLDSSHHRGWEAGSHGGFDARSPAEAGPLRCGGDPGRYSPAPQSSESRRVQTCNQNGYLVKTGSWGSPRSDPPATTQTGLKGAVRRDTGLRPSFQVVDNIRTGTRVLAVCQDLVMPFGLNLTIEMAEI